MKTKRIVLLATMMMTMGALSSQAQGLGGLFKKVKKGVESVTGSSATSSSTETAAPTTKGIDVPIEGGGTLRNPLSNIVDVQLVGVYGKPTSTNYGEVNLVFKVKMIANKTSVRFGGNINYPMLLIDQDGNAYEPHGTAGWTPFDVTEGVYMKIPLKESTAFVDVKQTATTVQQLQIGVSTSYEDTGLIVIKNVPIQWGVEP